MRQEGLNGQTKWARLSWQGRRPGSIRQSEADWVGLTGVGGWAGQAGEVGWVAMAGEVGREKTQVKWENLSRVIDDKLSEKRKEEAWTDQLESGSNDHSDNGNEKMTRSDRQQSRS